MPKTFSFTDELNALRVLKRLGVGEVALKAGISITKASRILKGRENDPVRLKKLRRVIETAPGPRISVH